MDDQGKLRFIGPPLRWCNAMVPGTGVMHGFAVRCNRVVSEGRRCTAEADHVRPEHAGECPGFQLARQDLICGACGHPLEQHSNADDLGDTQARPADAHRHIGDRGLTGPLCTAPLRDDGSCTAYPIDAHPRDHV